jgi:hypothetical protein
VLQGIALGYQTQVFRPLFFTFVVSAAATSPSTHVLGLVAAALTTMTAVIRGRQLDNGNSTTTMGQRRCMSTMMAMMGMAEMVMVMEMVTVMATATAIMLPPPPMARMLIKTMAAIQGQRLDNGNWMTMMGQQQ